MILFPFPYFKKIQFFLVMNHPNFEMKLLVWYSSNGLLASQIENVCI